MAFELASDLIHEAKISTRSEAGLAEYNPDDTSLPAMPSLSATIAAFDPSPPYLRCKRCQGKLLRGIQSLICIYCGHKLHQNADLAPDPISFKSTVGYRWFLEALRLDGSEKVGAANENNNQMNKGPSSPKDDTLLSDLLDLKIRWPTELETHETVTNEKPEKGKSSYNSSGIDLDNFLSFSKGENMSRVYKEQAVISNTIETAKNKTVGTDDDFSMFENIRSSEPAVTASAVQTTDDFSGWEADFQGADPEEQHVSNTFGTSIGSTVGSGGQHVSTTFDASFGLTVGSGNQHEGFKSTDAFIGSEIDLSAQLDTVFGSTKDPVDGKSNVGIAVSPAANDWTSVDPWDNANSEASLKAGELFPIVRPKDTEIQNSSNDPSTSIDWFQDDKWQTQSAPAPKLDTENGDHDSFDEWDNFTSSAPVKDPFENVRMQNDNDNNPEPTNFSSSFDYMDFGSFSQSRPLSGSPSKDCVSADANDTILEVPAIFSAVDTPSKVGDSAGHASQNVDDPPSKDDTDLEVIMSQMHDLSFMLETNLSIPSKSKDSPPHD